MNITELDSYNLADAVKFNNTLNPAIWQGQNMKPEVRERLMVIAQDFKEFLGLSDLEVKDITDSIKKDLNEVLTSFSERFKAIRGIN